jgi:rhodanese-related sulfurtransferase
MREARRFIMKKPGGRAGVAIGLALWVLPVASAWCQETGKKGVFVDGQFVEDYVYVPDFMTPEELKKRIEGHSSDFVTVDTAAPPIWEEEHIPGAVNVPWTRNLTPPVSLSREKTLVVYCACKNHEDSADIARQLSLLGYQKVKVLQGGWFRWVELGYPTVDKDERAAK